MLILASASPRRKELLELITPEFTVLVPQVEESLPPDTAPDRGVELLARRKAHAVLAEHPGATVVGADTLVVLDGTALGKPRDEAQAADMLRRLSGRRHTVYTGVAVARAGGTDSFVEGAQVEFLPLSEERIARYVATGEPMDKAGAYGIQGKGALLIRGITGDFYTVMGLPVSRLAEKLGEI